MIEIPVPPPVLSVACPLCHTVDRTVTSESLSAGAYWACARCGQKWTAERMERASAYQHTLVVQRAAAVERAASA